MLQLVKLDIYIGATTGTLAVPFVGEVELPVLLAVDSELLVEILISIVIGIPLLLLALKVLWKDFWPGRLLEQYREGKREDATDDDGTK